MREVHSHLGAWEGVVENNEKRLFRGVCVKFGRTSLEEPFNIYRNVIHSFLYYLLQWRLICSTWEMVSQLLSDIHHYISIVVVAIVFQGDTQTDWLSD
jgi:hypothetical protein